MSIVAHRLSCSTPVLIERMEGVRSASIAWLIPAGAGHDPEHLQGISTLWAELLQRGAGGRDSRAQADALDALGLMRDVENRAQYLRLTATMTGDRLLAALPLLVDMVRAPRFDADQLDPVRELAIASLHGLKDNPSERAHIELSRRHATPPINRSGLGTEQGLTAITQRDIVDGWKRQARADRSIIAIAGDVEPQRVIAELERLLGGWERGAPEIATRPNPERGSFVHIPDPSNQVQVYLAHEAPPEPSDDAKLEQIVASVLSGGSSSRLFTEVREKRALCYAVSAGYVTDKLFGRVVGYVGTTPERAQESLDVMLAELNKLTRAGGGRIERDEFERAVVGYRTRLVFSGESTAARASALASDQHRLGHGRTLEELQARVRSITLDQVNEYVSRRELGPITVVTLGPTEVKRQ
jgi:predicted Zn-dependent peptidase